MIKYVIKLVKKIIVAIIMLYGLNLITSNMGIIIPINFITIIVLTILGFPGLCTLIALYFLI